MRLRVREYAAMIHGQPRCFFVLEVGTEVKDVVQHRGWATFSAWVDGHWVRFSVLGKIKAW